MVDVKVVPDGRAWAEGVVAPSQDDLGACLFRGLCPWDAKAGGPGSVSEGAECYAVAKLVLIVRLWNEDGILDGTEDVQPLIK